MKIFDNRRDAGKQLAQKLTAYKNHPNTIVIGLPRGGVITADEIAQSLSLPLDIVVPRKIGAPFNPEMAVGALTPEGEVQLDQKIMQLLEIKEDDLTEIINDERKEAARRRKLYRGNRPVLSTNDKIVILVDDGMATGSTMKAALATLQKQKPQKIIVALPVASHRSIAVIEPSAHQIICLSEPDDFVAISLYYHEFVQTEDQEVIEILKNHA